MITLLAAPFNYMPTLIRPIRDFKILIDALSAPVGVTKVDRDAAELLREHIKHLISCDGTPPKVGAKYSPLGSNWPSAITTPEKKLNNWFRKPRVARKVPLNNTTTQEKIDDILKGLI